MQVAVTEHVADVQAGFEHPQDVAVAQRIPRVDDRVLAETHVHARFEQLVDPGHATAFREVIEAPLQMNAFGGAGDKTDPGMPEQAEQFGAVGIVVGAHGRGVAGGHARAHVAAAGFFSQHLEKARVRVVGFVAMHIHQATGALGQVHEELHRTHALIAGVFEMRNAADHVGAHVDRFFHQVPAVAVRLDALLGECDDLQVDQITAFLAHFEHGFKGGQLRIGDIDVGAYMLDAMGGEGLDGFLGAGLGVFLGDGRLAFAPAFDALEQRTAHVPAWLAGGQGCVEVDVRLDEGRYHQVATGIQIVGAQGRGLGLPGDVADQAVFQVQLMQAFLVTQPGVDDVHQERPFR